MNTKRVTAAAGVIHGSQVNGKQTATGIACDLESACLLQDPEVAKELAGYRALELGDVDGRVSATCSQPHHPTWLRAVDDTRGCPWCEIDAAHEETIGANLARWEEEQDSARLRLALASAQRGRREARDVARDAVRVAEESVTELRREHAENARLRERIAELEAQTKTARIEAIADVGDWLDEHGQKDAAHLVYTVDIPEARAMKAVPDSITRLLAPTQALREDEDPCHPCGCPKRFDRHAWGCPTLPEPGACEKCTDGPADWCPGCSTCRCETHNPGCVQAGNPR